MSSPSQPVAIKSPRLASSDTAGSVPSSFASGTPIIGVANLQALQYIGTPPPNIPPRAIPSSRRGSTTANLLGSGTSTPTLSRPVVAGLSAISGTGEDTPPTVGLDDLPDEEKAKVLRRHLVFKTEREGGPSAESVDSSSSDQTIAPGPSSRRPSSSIHHEQHQDLEPFPIPYHAPGADVTHDIYKWHTGVSRSRPRSASFAGSSTQQDPAFEHIHEPGGFRRNYVTLRAIEQGNEEPPMLTNFIDFLYIFGHFAGEDLEDEEADSKEEDEEEATAVPSRQISAGLPDVGEDSPLLDRRSASRSRTRRRRNSISPTGTATVTQAALMLTKSFVGTGVLFLGKAFYNGGLVFSGVTFVAIALISLWSFLLLLRTKFAVSGSFGDIGGTLYGPWMRYVILGSIVISQIGFVAAYTIFVANNFQAFVMGVTHCLKSIPIHYFILLQLIIFVPLALVRDIAKLSGTALAADAFILAGLVYIFSSEVSILASNGIADIKMFNPKEFSLFIGCVVPFEAG
ncbi:hypothetical protein C0993_005004 [Termitomyces sp. T159_Od127]|nr:hypothetical protein C0993_005004 [Termitomyces sp. T159_Od127]